MSSHDELRKNMIYDDKLQKSIAAFFEKLVKYYPERKVFALGSIDSSLGEKLSKLYKTAGFETAAELLEAYGFEIISGDEVKKIRNSVLYTPGNEPEIIKNKVESMLKRLHEYYPDRIIPGGLDKDHNNLSQNVSGLYKWLGYNTSKDMLAAYGFDLQQGAQGRKENDFSGLIDTLIEKYKDVDKPKSIAVLMQDNPDLKGQIKTLQNKANELFGTSLAKHFKEIGIIGKKNTGQTLKTDEKTPSPLDHEQITEDKPIIVESFEEIVPEEVTVPLIYTDSTSVISIQVVDGLVKNYLEANQLGNIFDILSELYLEMDFDVELNVSFARSLNNIFKYYINDYEVLRDNGDLDKNAILNLIDFIDTNKKKIDAEMNGEISLISTIPEQGFAYYQSLVYRDNQVKLEKWPYADGWRSGFAKIQDFNRKLIRGEIEELSQYSNIAIGDLIFEHPKAIIEYLEKEELKGNSDDVVVYDRDSEAFINAIEKSIFEFDEVDSITIKDNIFVLTGFEEEKDHLIKTIIDEGGLVKSSTVLATNYLIVNENYNHQTSKYKRALELKERGLPISIISLSMFGELINKL